MITIKNVCTPEASRSLAQYAIDVLKKQENINLTPFFRNKKEFRNGDVSGCSIIKGDGLNYFVLKDAIEGQDNVYGNFERNVGKMAENIVDDGCNRCIKRGFCKTVFL